MKEIVLNAEERNASAHSQLTLLRQNKKIPAVVYGDRKENLHVSVGMKELLTIIRGESGLNTIISLKVNNNLNKVIVHDIQRDVLTREIIHVDFYRITLTEKITVRVPVHLLGKAAGQEQGGVVDHIIREIEVECLPTNIPPKFEMDITHLNIGDAITVKELSVPSEVTLLADPGAILVHVVSADKEEPKPEAVAAEAAAEPEVIAKGKEKEEGAEAAGETPKEKPAPEKQKEDKEKK